jgi:acetyl-CoA carboxylase carboxyl transferase subunit alpha
LNQYLPFEKAIEVLETRASELRGSGDNGDGADMLEQRAHRQLTDLYSRLEPWQRVMVARHPLRPHFPQLVAGLFDDFMPISGDREFADDQAILGGFATFAGRSVIVIGHAKGEDTQARLRHNFGMAKPEGYRKAIRLMDLADRFDLPVVTLVDTPGAFPGIEAEERGQAEAIARSTEKCLSIGVPMVAIIVGEGGSGGAVALAAANRVLMMEHAVYSVISPEGCASILWRSSDNVAEAARAMKITAGELLRLNVIDQIIYEPFGGAHRDPELATNRIAAALSEALASLATLTRDELCADRRNKFLAMGHFL